MVTLKPADCPTLTEALRGLAVTAGAITTDVTVSVARPLVATPAELRTITKNVVPLSESDVEAMV